MTLTRQSKMTVNIENEYSGSLERIGENSYKGFLDPEEYKEIAVKVINAALDHEQCPYDVDVSLLLTDDEAIRSINTEYRNIDKSTDVLSFPLIDYESPACFDGFDDMDDLFNPDSGELMLGDIIISIDHCIAQAAEYGHGVVREYAFLIAHSMLHLMGYDHMTESEANEMFRRQEEILAGLGISR